MHNAWKSGTHQQQHHSPVSTSLSRVGSNASRGSTTSATKPIPSPQQTPGKSKVTANNSDKTKPAPSPWDQAQSKTTVPNRPILAKKGVSNVPKDMTGLFNVDEIQRLGKRFRKLDRDSSGALSLDEFMKIPELLQNPLVHRVVEIFDVDRNGEVDFKEFIQGISHFTVTGNKEKRLRFAFRIYDMDNDGFISNGELYQVMKTMVGGSMTDAHLQHVVDTTIILGDKDMDGKISFQEFQDLVYNGNDVHKKMIIEGI